MTEILLRHLTLMLIQHSQPPKWVNIPTLSNLRSALLACLLQDVIGSLLRTPVMRATDRGSSSTNGVYLRVILGFVLRIDISLGCDIYRCLGRANDRPLVLIRCVACGREDIALHEG